MTTASLTHAERVRLEALRYVTGPESATYVAIMRTFTGEIAGLLSDQSAAEVAARLAEQGFALDRETVDDRLSYLVEHGNLARSPRETEAAAWGRSARPVLERLEKLAAGAAVSAPPTQRAALARAGVGQFPSIRKTSSCTAWRSDNRARRTCSISCGGPA